MPFDDIALLAADTPVLAEGPGFFSELIAPILTDPSRAVWLAPTEEAKRRSAASRGELSTKHETSDPELASANIIERDLIMGRHIQEDCSTHGLKCLAVTRIEGVETAVYHVEAWFSSALDDPR